MALALTLVPLTLIQAVPCHASAEPALFFTEQEIIDRSNWVMEVTCTKLKDYMKFPNFTFYPVVQMRVSFIRSSRSESSKPVLYEDLWYHNGQPIGLKRYSTLKLKRLDFGAIYVKPGSEALENTRALANTIVRLSLDILTHDGTPTSVVVPAELHQQLITDLGTFGFHKRVPRSGPQVSVQLVANPRVYEAILYYDRPDE